MNISTSKLRFDFIRVRYHVRPMTNISADTPIPFAGDPLDFAETSRTPEQLQSFLSMTSARTILLHKGNIGIGNGGRPHRIHPSDLIGHDLMAPGPIFLGLEGERPIFAFSVTKPEEFLPVENFVSLRGLGGNLNPADLAIAGRAKSLFAWHFTEKFCVNCGGQTVSRDGGVKQQCTGCGAESFPRVSPVAIMLVTDGKRILLVRGLGWPERFMSALPGFISPGETIEEGCAREVKEEVGLTVQNVRYLFSQPWPFPSQLMMGLICATDERELTINKGEIEDAKWFSKDTVRDIFDKKSEEFLRPPSFTIAHQLLRYWLAE